MRTLQSITYAPSGESNIRSMDQGPIKEVLGKDAPNVTPDALGRMNLTNALKQKFGNSYKTNPTSASAMHHFEKEFNYFKTVRGVMAGKQRVSGHNPGRMGGGGNQNG